MLYATIFFQSFYRDGVRTRIELVPVHSTNRLVTAIYLYTTRLYIYLELVKLMYMTRQLSNKFVSL